MKETTTTTHTISENTKVNVTVIGMIIAVVVWLCLQLFPMQEKVAAHQREMTGVNVKLDILLLKVGNIEGELKTQNLK